MSGQRYSFRWGIEVLDSGHVPVYRFMLRNYSAAGVTRDEFMLIIHLADYHYEKPDSGSWPSRGELARQMGYSHVNSVDGLINGLKQKGMLVVTSHPGKTNSYDFSNFSKRMWELWKKRTPSHPNVAVPSHPNVNKEEEGKNRKPVAVAKANGNGESGNGHKRKADPLYEAVVFGLTGKEYGPGQPSNGLANRIAKALRDAKLDLPELVREDYAGLRAAKMTPTRDALKVVERIRALKDNVAFQNVGPRVERI